VANWTDNLLTITGPPEALETLVHELEGAHGPLDFTRHLPDPPVDDDGDVPDWWSINADEATLTAHEPTKLTYFFRSIWEPPLPWAEAVHQAYPQLRMSLLHAQEEDGVVGLWVGDDAGTDENWLSRRVVGYPAVWNFLTEMGCNFGWDDPDEDADYRAEAPQVG
jgi:hypothetical protein